jgi:tetratricopeptide (TPR) repeat protein
MDLYIDHQGNVVGGFLFLAGLLADIVLGILWLSGGLPHLWLWHIPAVLFWSVGINLFCTNSQCRSEITTFSRFFGRWNRWGVSALVLGLMTFPGCGSCALSLTLLVARLRVLNPAEKKPELEIAGHYSQIPPTPPGPAQPLIDELRMGDTEAMRAVVAKIGQYGRPDTTLLLRQLLSDTRAEVRRDAALALTKLEGDLAQTLNQAYQAWQAAPEDRVIRLALIDQAYHFGKSNVLDNTSQRFYLQLARDLLTPLLAEDSDGQLWLQLAYIHESLGELVEALHAAQQALSGLPEIATPLVMDLAFRAHAWNDLLAIKGNVSKLPQTEQPILLEPISWQQEALHG